MLKKILKYDLLWSFKLILIYQLLGMIFAVTAKLCEVFPDTIFFSVLVGILKGCALSCLIPGVINSIIRSWVRLISNMYKDEAHLTHTLPVDIRVHYLSKVLSGIILVGVSSVVLIGGVALMYLDASMIEKIKDTLSMLSTTFDVSFITIVILAILVLVLEIIFITLAGYFGIIWGYSFNNYKLPLSFAIGFLFVIGCNVMTVVTMLLSGIFDPRLYQIMFTQNAQVEYSMFIVLLIMASVLYFIYIVLAYVLSNYKLKKGVNID